MIKSAAFIPAIISVFSFTIVNAQIIYTNIKDVTLTCNKKCGHCYHYSLTKTYPLDLNNDGSPDFNMTAYRAVSHYDGCQGVYCCLDDIVNNILITALNDNSVIIGPSGTALISGVDISSLSEWSTGYFNLKSVTEGHGYYCEILKEGDWPNSSDRYLGLRIISNGQTYYGWGRLSVFVDISEASFKIKDYAYNGIPNQPILAGETGTTVAKAGYGMSAKNARFDELKIAPNPVTSTAMITFSLSTPGKVSIRLYDKTSTLVMNVADREFTKGSHQIQLDTKGLEAGIYLLRLQSEGILQTRKFIVIK